MKAYELSLLESIVQNTKGLSRLASYRLTPEARCAEAHWRQANGTADQIR